MSEDPHFRRLRAEFQRLVKAFPPRVGRVNWKVMTNDLHNYKFWLKGSDNTPYQGGTFLVAIELPPEYPVKPPIVNFVTQIWHPNIAVGGRHWQWGSNVCLSLVNWNAIGQPGGWKPTIFLPTVIEQIENMLEVYKPHPGDDFPEVIVNPKDPFNKEAGQQMLNNYELFAQRAREWTLKYAINTSLDS